MYEIFKLTGTHADAAFEAVVIGTDAADAERELANECTAKLVITGVKNLGSARYDARPGVVLYTNTEAT